MKPIREVLYFECSEGVDTSTAGLLKRVLRNRGEHTNGTDSGPPSLCERLERWLKEGTIQKMLPLSVEDVEVCIEIIKTQVEIANETPGINESNGTSTPPNISQARDCLPGMKEFAAGQSPVAK